METIEFLLAGFGCIVLVIIAVALIQEGVDKLRVLGLQWKFHGDAANSNSAKIRELDRKVEDLTLSVQCLHESFRNTQPKKAKAK